MEPVSLNDGNRIPALGIGTWLGEGETVRLALKHGYRLVDTATFYEYAFTDLTQVFGSDLFTVISFCSNEGEVGTAVKQSGIPRKDIFVVTKVSADF